jgi:hypothetical protein
MALLLVHADTDVKMLEYMHLHQLKYIEELRCNLDRLSAFERGKLANVVVARYNALQRIIYGAYRETLRREHTNEPNYSYLETL